MATVGDFSAGDARCEERLDGVDLALQRARDRLLDLARPDGHWCFELEADCTIPAEYILMMHFVDEIDSAVEKKIAVYLREQQAEHGGWPLYRFGAFDISASVKSYWALKLAGDDRNEPHMKKARKAILTHGGAARCNVFTRITMALFGQIPWRGVPLVPVEMILFPRWFPFHLSRVSYWSRTVAIPLAILCSLKARAANPRGVGIGELFTRAPEVETGYSPARSRMNRLLLAAERAARVLLRLMPRLVRRRALREAEHWLVERLNGVHGLGAIFPAMVNAYEALVVLGRPPGDPERCLAREAVDRLLVVGSRRAYCQPCVSPVWDTALASIALQEAQAVHPDERATRALEHAATWLRARQVLEGPADWREDRPDLEPGGWAFQYRNDRYPDLDDTAVVAWVLHRASPERHAESIRRAADWVCGMQSRNGGFAAFDADNTSDYLNEIPFADHGALLDPPTVDVSARCATLLALLGRPSDSAALRDVLDFLFEQQEGNGAWFGRWGTNYVYGTWSALCALEFIDDERKQSCVNRAAAWLVSVQRADGSWGESNDTYVEPEGAGTGDEGTPFQTAWAVLGLIAAGRSDSNEVRRGVDYLLRTQTVDGSWSSEHFTCPGFPRVFYLRYHGYQHYFPLWALARYRSSKGEPAG